MEHKAWEWTNINDFFDAYSTAMLQQDTKLMTRFYELPCTMMADENSNVYTELNKLEALFNQGIVYYGHLGVKEFRPEVWSRYTISPHYIKVKVLWHHCDKDGAELYSCFYEYILAVDKNGFLKMQVVIAVDEKEQLQYWQNMQS